MERDNVMIQDWMKLQLQEQKFWERKWIGIYIKHIRIVFWQLHRHYLHWNRMGRKEMCIDPEVVLALTGWSVPILLHFFLCLRSKMYNLFSSAIALSNKTENPTSARPYNTYRGKLTIIYENEQERDKQFLNNQGEEMKYNIPLSI